MKYDELLEINGNKLSKKYIESLSKQERLDLIDPIFNLLRNTGWLYPDDEDKIAKEYKRLVDHKPDLNSDELFNNSSLATGICKYFCHKFYSATETKYKTMLEIFNDDDLLKKIIYNRLGLEWIDNDGKGPGVNESFNLSFRMIVQGMRSSRYVPSISIFKPDIAKYMYMKYSEVGDTVYDYSAGWGGRLLGAASCNRKYIGTDPWTTDELKNMIEYLKLPNITLINNGSENVRLEENSIDFSFSSPPYYNQEVYSKDITQAYSQGEDYFYDVYWTKTMENVKYMLKPGKKFGLNILAKYTKMVDIAKKNFGEPVEIIKLRTIKSHLGKNQNKGIDGIQKFEPIYVFENNK